MGAVRGGSCSGARAAGVQSLLPAARLVIVSPLNGVLGGDGEHVPLMVGGDRQHGRPLRLADAGLLVVIAVGLPGVRSVGDDQAMVVRAAGDGEPIGVTDQLGALQMMRAPRLGARHAERDAADVEVGARPPRRR